MYALFRLYWDWILIIFIAAFFAAILLSFSLLLVNVTKGEHRLYGYKCPSCSSTQYEIHWQLIRNQVLSVLNIIESPIAYASAEFKPSNDRRDRSCLFDEERDNVDSEYIQETPLGRVRLLIGMTQTWPSDGIDSCIYSGRIDTGMECWMVTSSYPNRKGGMHPLEIEFLMANCFRCLNICPEPLYISNGTPGIYGSFTQVEERYMLYQLPVNSELITKLAFKNISDISKHLKACCGAIIALLSAVGEMHIRGVSHGALDDDAVVIVSDTKVLLVNLSRVSTEISQQFSDIISIFEIFSYIVSRGFTRNLHELSGIRNEGRPCIHSDLHDHIDEMQSMKLSGSIPSRERLMKCFKEFQRCI